MHSFKSTNAATYRLAPSNPIKSADARIVSSPVPRLFVISAELDCRNIYNIYK